MGSTIWKLLIYTDEIIEFSYCVIEDHFKFIARHPSNILALVIIERSQGFNSDSKWLHAKVKKKLKELCFWIVKKYKADYEG